MITKEMKKFLSKLPPWPKNVSFETIGKDKENKDYLHLRMFLEAKTQGFVGVNGKDENSGIYLTEKGRQAIDEYQRAKNASSQSTWALVISALSFLASVVAIILAR